MRRTVIAVLLAAFAALVLPAPQQSSALIPPVTGRIFDVSTGEPVAAVTVEIVADEAGEPGMVLAEGETDADGRFSINATTGDDIWVRVVADNRVQAGYVGRGSAPHSVEWDFEAARTYAPGTSLGRINALPSYIRGRIVRADRPRLGIAGVRVSLRDALALPVSLASTTTNSAGFFRINGIEGEDFGLKINGNKPRYETGWRACNAGVVASWGNACASPIGPIGNVLLELK